MDQPDFLPHLSKQIGNTHHWQPEKTRIDFHALSLVNKFLHTYYTDEQTQQNIIDSVFINHIKMTNHEFIARSLGCNKIARTIQYFTTKICDSQKLLGKQDLKNTSRYWYLNISIEHRYPLLNAAIASGNVQKVTIMTNSPFLKIQCNAIPGAPTQCPLRYIAELRTNRCHKNEYLDIALLLLKKITPDHRVHVSQRTPLMCAVMAKDKEMTRLLLDHGANPYLITAPMNNEKKQYTINSYIQRVAPDPENPDIRNAFMLEQGEPKGWLKAMYDEIQQKK